MKKIQKVYLIHDYLYASLNPIPSKSFDGKDQPKEVYIHIEQDITELSSEKIIFYHSYEEAQKQL